MGGYCIFIDLIFAMVTLKWVEVWVTLKWVEVSVVVGGYWNLDSVFMASVSDLCGW